jgi:hypothetical protein
MANPPFSHRHAGPMSHAPGLRGSRGALGLRRHRRDALLGRLARGKMDGLDGFMGICHTLW